MENDTKDCCLACSKRGFNPQWKKECDDKNFQVKSWKFTIVFEGLGHVTSSNRLLETFSVTVEKIQVMRIQSTFEQF